MTQLIRRWGNNIRIISYDHRGHGDSGNASMHTYRIDRLADDLAELLVALGVTGPLTLAGHSMGGMTALAYLRRPASKRPVEPESLVLVATAAGNLGSHGLGRLLSTPATSMLYHLVHRMPRAGTDEVVQFLARPVCAALTRHGGYGEAAPNGLDDDGGEVGLGRERLLDLQVRLDDRLGLGVGLDAGELGLHAQGGDREGDERAAGDDDGDDRVAHDAVGQRSPRCGTRGPGTGGGR